MNKTKSWGSIRNVLNGVVNVFTGWHSDGTVWSDYNENVLQAVYQLQTAIEMENNPKIICYCGSLRVADEAFKKAEYESVLDGHIALLPCCMFVDIQREYGAESDYKQLADQLHKRKIDLCDEVFVLNVGGYIGESTRNEIKYAEEIGKPVSYLETPNP